MTEQPAAIFGIDLGTTYSCIARMDDYGRPEAIPNLEGSRITPSVVFFDSGDQVIVGQVAKNNAHLFPDQIVEIVKRQMGKSDWTFFYNGRDYTPEELSSYILRKVVGDADVAGRAAVITEVEGTAYRSAASTFTLDPNDPLGEGFLLR